VHAQRLQLLDNIPSGLVGYIYMRVGLPFEQAEIFVNLTTHIGAKVIPPLTYA
jgi:hypothetical protein